MHPDTQMMEFIYHELDDQAEQQFRAHVDGCSRCGAELASLEQTLDTVRAVPDEEPPAAITTRLLHEAAKRAPKPGSMGWWSQFLAWAAPVAHHPALAAAAMLLFVGGITGYLTYQGMADEQVMRVEQPGVSVEFAPRAPVAEAEAPEPEAPTDLAKTPVELRSQLAQEPLADDDDPVGRLAPQGLKADDSSLRQITAEPNYNKKPQSPAKFADQLDTGSSPSRTRSSGSTGGQRGRKSGGTGRTRDFKAEQGWLPNASPPPPASAAPSGMLGNATAADRGESLEVDGDDEGAREKNGPVVQSASAPAEEQQAPAKESKKARANKQSARQPRETTSKQVRKKTEPERLHDMAAAAAKKSNCAAMQRHVKEIQRQDVSYYRNRVENDRRLDRCMKKRRAKSKRSPQSDDAYDAPAESEEAQPSQK